MTLISFAIGIIAGTPDKFPILAVTSISCVVGGEGFLKLPNEPGAILFTVWFVRNRATQTITTELSL